MHLATRECLRNCLSSLPSACCRMRCFFYICVERLSHLSVETHPTTHVFLPSQSSQGVPEGFRTPNRGGCPSPTTLAGCSGHRIRWTSPSWRPRAGQVAPLLPPHQVGLEKNTMNQPEPITSQIFATDCLEEYQRLEEELTELWHLIDGIDTKRKRAVLLMTKCQEAHKAFAIYMA